MSKVNRLTILVLFVAVSASIYTQDFWEEIPLPDSLHVRSMQISPQGDFYLGMYGFEMPGGVYKSTDNAQTWEYLGLNEFPVYTIELCANGDILAGVYDEIYKSTDGGQNWYSVFEDLVNFICIKSSPNGYIFAGGAGNFHGVVRSTDYGENWDTSYIFPSYWNETLDALEISPEGYIYAGSSSIFGPGGIYRSTDMGESWEIFDYPGMSAVSIAFSPDDKMYVGTIGSGLFIYDFFGDEWNHPLYQITPSGFVFAGYNKVFVGCNANPTWWMKGILYSNDGGNNYDWLNSGMPGDGIPVDGIMQHPDGYIYLFDSYASYLYRSTDIVVSSSFQEANNRIFSIFPNPWTDFTTIQWKNDPSIEVVSLYFKDLHGKTIFETKIPNTGRYHLDQMKIHGSGVYTCTIQEANSVVSGKMVFVK